jgi:hypothetical protein
VVALASDDTGVATVAGSVTVPAGAMSAQFSVDPVGPGTATIFATSGGITVSCSIDVLPAAATGVPTLDAWALLLMIAALLAVGVFVVEKLRL